MSRFGRRLDRNLKSLASEAVLEAPEDPDRTKEKIQRAGRQHLTGGTIGPGIHPRASGGIVQHMAGRGRTGKRGVEGVKTGLAQNAGDTVGGSEAVLSLTILKRRLKKG